MPRFAKLGRARTRTEPLSTAPHSFLNRRSAVRIGPGAPGKVDSLDYLWGWTRHCAIAPWGALQPFRMAPDRGEYVRVRELSWDSPTEDLHQDSTVFKAMQRAKNKGE